VENSLALDSNTSAWSRQDVRRLIPCPPPTAEFGNVAGVPHRDKGYSGGASRLLGRYPLTPSSMATGSVDALRGPATDP